ncbi:uncharacterized protein [Nicotiana tomentosiformis]|uniref:uncharacterized protein n=1 Tax=Nicotiana tomentosiformis TaxID=4098 RepID=UPI00388CC849
MEYEPVFLDTAIAWMSGAVSHLKNWVMSVVLTSTYTERAWRDFSKGRWEARTHGLGKYAVMRPPSGDEEVLPPIPKSEKVIKRKRASDSEDQKPKKRVARKPKVNIIPLTMESLDKVEEGTLTQVPEQREIEDVLPRGKETVEEVADTGVQNEREAAQDGGGAQKDLFGEKEIEDSPSLPSFSQSMIRDAQAVETCHVEGTHGEEDPFHGYFNGVEDVTGPSDLEAPKKSSSEYEAKVRRLTGERDALKLLSEQRKGEVKGLRAELEAYRKEQVELAEQVKRIFEFNDIDLGVMASSSVPQVEQKFDVIRQLCVEVDVVKSEAEEWKKNMDHLVLEKDTARTQLASAEAQLRSLKEKFLVQAKKNEEFQSRLSSANSDRERLATELSAAKSKVEKTMANADAMVAIYRADAEAAQVRAKEVAEAAKAQANWVAEHAKYKS